MPCSTSVGMAGFHPLLKIAYNTNWAKNKNAALRSVVITRETGGCPAGSAGGGRAAFRRPVKLFSPVTPLRALAPQSCSRGTGGASIALKIATS